VITCILRCDQCGAVAELEGKKPPARWGTLNVDGGIRDVCPGCIARLGGWRPEGLPLRTETA
jgi:hypothetical protein